MSVLAERLLTIHSALETAGVPHAFGGAIALAYCTGEPRGTQDLDINIFCDHAQADGALMALPPQVAITAANRRQIAVDGQTRAWWDTTPVDLFFNNTSFHEQVHARIRLVPFVRTTIPVLDCFSLAMFKVCYDRTKDWADLEAMHGADQLDAAVLQATIAELIGRDDQRLRKLAALREHLPR